MKLPCRSFLLALVFGLFAQNVSAGERFKFDISHSTIGFSIHQFLGTVKGKFSQFAGVIDLDRDHPEHSSVTATIKAASIDTRIAKRDEHMRGSLFQTEKFPEINFKSRSVKRTGPESADIVGDFTMHGVTRSITLQVKFLGQTKGASENDATRWHVTTAPLKRSDFGLRWSQTTENISMIGNDVSVNIEIEAVAER